MDPARNPLLVNLLRQMNLGSTSTSNILNDYTANLERGTTRKLLLDVHRDGMNCFGQTKGTHKPSKSQPSHFANKIKLNPKSIVNIAELISVSSIGKSQQGKTFLCRSLAPPFQMNAINMVVDDPKGQKAVRLCLYNYNPTRMEDLQDVFPVGTILAIKSPLFKATLDGGFAVRCDNAAEVQIISAQALQTILPGLKWNGDIPKEYRTPNNSTDNAATILALKTLGNKHFEDRRYREAIQTYTEGMEIDPSNLDLLSNRGLVYLRMGCFNKASMDLDQLLRIEPFHVKGIYRKVKTLWGLRQYEISVKFLKSTFSKKADLKKNKDWLGMLESAEKYLTESRTGKLDLGKLLNVKCNEECNAPEYTGSVKVVDIEDKGRGLIATQDFRAGQLILSSKAFAITCASEDGDKLNIKLNQKARGMYTPGHEHKLMQKISTKLALEPKLGQELFKLYAGPKLCYLSQKVKKADIDRINSIVRLNSFAGDVSFSQTKSNQLKEPASYGLWILPSYINHSCSDSNSYWSVHGDIMLVRATKPIKSGEEIVFAYTNPTRSYSERIGTLEDHDFVCRCRLCQLDFGEESLEVRNERNRLVEYFNNFMKTSFPAVDGSHPIAEVEEALQNISKLESLNSEFYPELNLTPVWSPLKDFVGKLWEIKRPQDSMELLQKLHLISKDTGMARESVNVAKSVVVTYLRMNEEQLARKWLAIFKEDYQTAYGSLDNMKYMLEEYSDLIGMLRKFEIDLYE